MTEQDRPLRMRVIFGKGQGIKYISNLDMMRTWERSLRRAGVGLAYSGGFNPGPRLQIAAALPVGHTGSAEVMDVYLENRISPGEFEAAVRPVLPGGLTLVDVYEVEASADSLQSTLCMAGYVVSVEVDSAPQEVQGRIDALLGAEEVVQERTRRGRQERFDLRPLVEEVRVLENGPPLRLWMLLRAGARGNARPESVLDALGFAGAAPQPQAPQPQVERVKLLFEECAGSCCAARRGVL